MAYIELGYVEEGATWVFVDSAAGLLEALNSWLYRGVGLWFH